jgi:flagellar basal body-associated protein FliL
MRRRLAIALSGLVLVHVGAASAAEPAKKPAQPDYFDLQPIGFPVMSKGALVNYVFVSFRLMLKPGQDAARLREREPYLRDTLVRQGSRSPFNSPTDFVHLDDRRLKAATLAASNQFFGPGVVTSVQVLTETPQRRTGLLGR